ncbi:MAG: hypothetical protein HZB26_14140 [Candidatus Hydrogenedentes bacterium]|nr:hypothetical protein [Candidatus Hydrogenedentota bacterium]
MNGVRLGYRTTELRLALALYRADHGEYPATLEALAPNYLERLPNLPGPARDFRYLREGSDYWLFAEAPGPDGRPSSAGNVIYGPEELVAKLRQR